MASKPTRLSWIITGLAALLLLGATVVLGIRERFLSAGTPGAGGGPPLAASDTVNPSAPRRPEDARNGLIAFVSDRDGNEEIYVMRPDGSDQTRITDDPAQDTSPAWTDDGNWLFWARIEDTDSDEEFGSSGDTWHLMAARPDGREQHTLASGQGWLRGGGANADLGRLAIYTVQDSNGDGEPGEDDDHRLLMLDLAGEPAEAVDLLADFPDLVPSEQQAFNAVLWSPDGATLYVMLAAGDRPGLYALPVDGGEPRLLVEGTIWQVALSYDGRLLALWHEFEDTGRRLQRLKLYDLETGQLSDLLLGGLRLNFITSLSWSRDSTRLLFMGGSGYAAPQIYSFSVAENQVISLSQSVDDPAFMPAWAPDGLYAVFVAQHYRSSRQGFTPDGDANIYIVDDLGATTTQITAEQGNNNQPAWQPVFQ